MRLFSILALAVLTLCPPPPASAQVHATAMAGEGIYSLLRRSGVTPNSASVEAFRKLNAAVLGGSTTLVRGRKYRVPTINDAGPQPGRSRALPTAIHLATLDRSAAEGRAGAKPAARTIDMPLFGASYRDVAITESTLEGHVYYVVSGHGGPDPGTVDTYAGSRIAEDEIAYDTALRLARELMSLGATVHVIVQDPNDGIRDQEVLPVDYDEEYIGGDAISRDHNKRLDDRASIINKLYDEHRGTARSQRLVSIHVDARGGKVEPQLDVHFLYASKSGRAFADVLRSTIADQYELHQPGRGYDGSVAEREGLKILKDTKPVAVLIELGNIGHRGDQHRLVKPGNRQALAEWIAEGLRREARGLRG